MPSARPALWLEAGARHETEWNEDTVRLSASISSEPSPHQTSTLQRIRRSNHTAVDVLCRYDSLSLSGPAPRAASEAEAVVQSHPMAKDPGGKSTVFVALRGG